MRTMERFLRGFCQKVKQFSLGDGDGWIPASPTPSTLDPILFLCDLWQLLHIIFRGFPGGSEDRESSAYVRDPGSISGSGRFPGGKHGTPLQCSCQENPRDRAAWRAIVHGVTKSWTRLKWLSTHEVFKLASRYISESVEWVSKILTCPERVLLM